MCAWRVDQMVDHLNVSYLYKKRGVFYFSKRVPCDVKSYYKSDRIVFCLKTKSNVSAIRSLYQKLDDYWTSIRLTKIQVPAQHMLVSKPPVNSNSNAPLLSEALSTYLKLKGEGKDKTFIRGANRNIKYVIELLGDLPIDDYSSKDASKFRDYLLDKGLLISSVKRVFSSIRSIINLSITEEGINCINAFSKTYMPESTYVEIRKPIPIKDIKLNEITKKFPKLNANIMGVIRNDKFLILKKNDVMQMNDKAYVIINTSQMSDTQPGQTGSNAALQKHV